MTHHVTSRCQGLFPPASKVKGKSPGNEVGSSLEDRGSSLEDRVSSLEDRVLSLEDRVSRIEKQGFLEYAKTRKGFKKTIYFSKEE